MKLHNALVSVYEKTRIIELAKNLLIVNISIISTDGTYKFLFDFGINTININKYLGYFETLEGRIKTIHPKIYYGILANRKKNKQLFFLKKQNIRLIDILVINLYPFNRIIKELNCKMENAIDNIDIGGTSMIRSGAKNYGSFKKGVIVLIDSKDYKKFILNINKYCVFNFYVFKLSLSYKAYSYTSYYDNSISFFLNKLINFNKNKSKNFWPNNIYLKLQLYKNLRYGENPHQKSAIYILKKEINKEPALYKQINGKNMSYNNVCDSESALKFVSDFSKNTCVIFKHGNPCGASSNKYIKKAYYKSIKSDPVSLFGGIIAFNVKINYDFAKIIINNFFEIIIAPSYEEKALKVLSKRKNIIILIYYKSNILHRNIEIKKINEFWLTQIKNNNFKNEFDMDVVTKIFPRKKNIESLNFAWNIIKYVKSNAIVIVKNNMILGIGTGQMSRIDSSIIAISKAKKFNLDLKNSIASSDAFFPFNDAFELLIKACVKNFVQPGGSNNDKKIVSIANKNFVSMIFTGIRYFSH